MYTHFSSFFLKEKGLLFIIASIIFFFFYFSLTKTFRWDYYSVLQKISFIRIFFLCFVEKYTLGIYEGSVLVEMLGHSSRKCLKVWNNLELLRNVRKRLEMLENLWKCLGRYFYESPTPRLYMNNKNKRECII